MKNKFFTPRRIAALILGFAGMSLVVIGVAAPRPAKVQAPKVSTATAVTAGISPNARDLPTNDSLTAWPSKPLPDVERLLAGRESSDTRLTDPVVQTSAATGGMPGVGVSFDGINIAGGCGGCLPPDPNGAVGPNHYLQMVNTSFAVFSKSNGAVLKGPTQINALWSLTPNSECAIHNDGDPIVVYDQLADRWVLSQFIASPNTGESYAECVAVSTSPDPTGSYYLYEFDESATVFHDYPKLGVWPDAYYMSSNEFPNGSETNSGAGAFAFERAKMLAGQPARFVWFDESSIASGAYTPGGQNPTNLEGRALPPAGAPNYFIETDVPPSTPPTIPPATSAVMSIWKFHVDWNNPVNSTFGTGSTAPVASGGGLYMGGGGQPDFIIPIANYVVAECVYGEGPNCVPEKLSPPLQPATLDTLGDRIMFRATYRNFGDHESLIVSHTSVTSTDVTTGLTRTGIRWYELRNLSATPTVYQQSTFAPLDTSNPIWRWMGSAAMDHTGDLAIGYSASGPTYFPSLHYAGRLATDPLSDLTQGEAVLFQGLGIQAYPLDRWGDYSDLTVDPTDDCTFWYTNEYLAANSVTDVLPVVWQTRIGSFRFPQCVSAAIVPLTNVVSRMTHGNGQTFDVNMPLNGNPGIECRNSGTGGNYTIVFQFANALTNVSSAAVTSGTGSVSSSGIGTNPNEYIVNLTGVTNAQYLTVTLTNVQDVAGNAGTVVSPRIGILIGDVNATGLVDSGDVFLVRQQTGQNASSSNFREDVNVSGLIDSGDVFVTRQQTSTSLP